MSDLQLVFVVRREFVRSKPATSKLRLPQATFALSVDGRGFAPIILTFLTRFKVSLTRRARILHATPTSARCEFARADKGGAETGAHCSPAESFRAAKCKNSQVQRAAISPLNKQSAKNTQSAFLQCLLCVLFLRNFRVLCVFNFAPQTRKNTNRSLKTSAKFVQTTNKRREGNSQTTIS